MLIVERGKVNDVSDHFTVASAVGRNASSCRQFFALIGITSILSYYVNNFYSIELNVIICK